MRFNVGDSTGRLTKHRICSTTFFWKIICHKQLMIPRFLFFHINFQSSLCFFTSESWTCHRMPIFATGHCMGRKDSGLWCNRASAISRSSYPSRLLASQPREVPSVPAAFLLSPVQPSFHHPLIHTPSPGTPSFPATFFRFLPLSFSFSPLSPLPSLILPTIITSSIMIIFTISITS